MTKLEIFENKKSESIERVRGFLDDILKAENVDQMRRACTVMKALCDREIAVYARMATFLSAKNEFDPDPKNDEMIKQSKNLMDYAIPILELEKWKDKTLYIFKKDMESRGIVALLQHVDVEHAIISGEGYVHACYGTIVFAVPEGVAYRLHPEYFCCCRTSEKRHKEGTGGTLSDSEII